MGIKSLNQLLKKYDNIHNEIHISSYAYKKIAIDISNYMYKYKFTQGDNWISGFIQLIACLRRNNIHCVFIYDSPAPDEKKNEQAKRRESREKDKQKIYELEKDMKTYINTGNMSDKLKILSDKLESDNKPRLLSSSKRNDTMNNLENYMDKIKNRTIDIKKEDFDISKKLFTLFGIPYYIAPSEAETMCSDLCKRGIVDAVLSEDTDVLAYGTPFLLNHINTVKDTCIEVNFSCILTELNYSYEQFLDMCIMCGTDYNSNIEGVAVLNAHKLIMQYKSIEGIESHINNSNNILTKIETKCFNNISILNHNRTRELFTQYIKSDIELLYCVCPNWIELQKFLFINNCNYDLSYIKKYFEPQKITFLD